MPTTFSRRALCAVVLLSGAALAQPAPPPADAGPADLPAPAPPDAPADAGSPDAGLSAEDLALLREIEAASAAPAAAPATPSPAAPASPQRGVNLLSNVFNPAISVNGLLLGSLSSAPVAPDASPAALQLQELELQFLSNVDPYFTASITLSVPHLETLEIEEGYVAAIPQPLGFGVRIGKMRNGFGRENALHTHALPFVERSLVNDDVFGPEGLSEVGLELSWLAPVPWYALLTVTGMDGANDALFGSPRGKDFAGLAALRNVFDLTDDATLEAGVSYAVGNDADLLLAHALGAHLVFRWRPAANARNRSVMVTLEGLLARRPSAPGNPEPLPHDTGGFYGSLQVQLHRGWYLAARYDLLGHRGPPPQGSDPPVDPDLAMRQSLGLVFAPTEFSAFRLQLTVTEPPAGAAPVVQGLLQANFTIGAHPAHAY